MDNKNTFVVDATLNGVPIGPDEVMYLSTSRRFETNRYPTRVLCVTVPPSTFSTILKGTTPDKPFINVHLIVSCIETKDDGSTKIPRIMYSGVYRGIVDKSCPDSEIEEAEDKLDQVYRLRVALFDEADLYAFGGGTVSGMFDNVTVGDLMVYAFEACRGSTLLKLAAADPDSKKPVKSLAIKPMGFMQFMDFIDKEYGVYASKFNVYIEEHTVYIINTQKSDGGMSAILPDPKMGKIIIEVQDKRIAMATGYGVTMVDGHSKYNIFDNNSIIDDISADNIVTATVVTVNSDGTTSSKKPSDNKFDHISSEIRVEEGRNRGVTKSYKNPKFSATVAIQDLPVVVYPFSVVRYNANNRVGDCMISESVEVISHGSYTNTLKIKSYDELLLANIKESKSGKNMNREEPK